MSYRAVPKRRLAGRTLGGLTSQPPGRRVNAFSLGAAAVEYTPAIALPPPPPAKIVGRKGGIAVRRARGVLSGLSSQPPGRPVSAFALGSLGVDPSTSSLATSTLAQPTVLDPQTAAWQQQVIANQQLQLAQADKDHLQKWVQIAVTASIPLFGAIWKLLFKAGER